MGSHAAPRAPHSNPADWLAPFYIVSIIDSLTFGILCGQVWTYYSSFPKDPAWMKRVVDLAFCLSILKFVQSFYLAWENCVLGFEVWGYALKIDWAFWMSAFIETPLTATVQVYFVWRCYALTGRNRYFLAVLIAMMLVGFTLSAGFAVQLVKNPFDKHATEIWVLPMFVVNIVLDIVITVTISYKLITSRKDVNRNTQSVLTKIVAITWESALPPTIFRIWAFLTQYTAAGRLRGWNYAIAGLAARLFVFSLLYSLNSRLEIREFSRLMQAADFSEDPSTMELSEIRFRKNELDSNMISTFGRGEQMR